MLVTVPDAQSFPGQETDGCIWGLKPTYLDLLKATNSISPIRNCICTLNSFESAWIIGLRLLLGDRDHSNPHLSDDLEIFLFYSPVAGGLTDVIRTKYGR